MESENILESLQYIFKKTPIFKYIFKYFWGFQYFQYIPVSSSIAGHPAGSRLREKVVANNRPTKCTKVIDQFQSNDAMLNWGANSENQDLHIWFDSGSCFAWIQF